MYNFSNDHCLHHIMNVEKQTFNFYIYTKFLDCFSFSFVMMRWELSEICGPERLFIDKFGHDVQQPSP